MNIYYDFDHNLIFCQNLTSKYRLKYLDKNAFHHNGAK